EQAVLLHFSVERYAADAQAVSRPAAAKADAGQGLLDGDPFLGFALNQQFFPGNVLIEGAPERVFLNRWSQVLEPHLVILADEHRLLHGVFELADVPRPGERSKRG